MIVKPNSTPSKPAVRLQAKPLWTIRMKTATIISIIFFVLTINVHGQKQFSFTDTSFEIGQIARVDIIYDLSGGSSISPKSLKLVDSIVLFLKRNINLFVEFDANSDYRDLSERNEILTKWRAESLRNYCIGKGIDSSRIKSRGYGENQPLIVDSQIHNEYPFLKLGQELNETYVLSLNDKEKQEIANSLNRRTEIKITKINSP